MIHWLLVVLLPRPRFFRHDRMMHSDEDTTQAVMRIQDCVAELQDRMNINKLKSTETACYTAFPTTFLQNSKEHKTLLPGS